MKTKKYINTNNSILVVEKWNRGRYKLSITTKTEGGNIVSFTVINTKSYVESYVNWYLEIEYGVVHYLGRFFDSKRYNQKSMYEEVDNKYFSISTQAFTDEVELLTKTLYNHLNR